MKLAEISNSIKPSFGFISACDASIVKKSSKINLTCNTIHGRVHLQQLNKGKEMNRKCKSSTKYFIINLNCPQEIRKLNSLVL